MSSLDLLAVPETDFRSFEVALQAYKETFDDDGGGAINVEIVPRYPDAEYKLGRDIAAVFGHNLYCVKYPGTSPGFTDRRSIFLKDLERGADYFMPVWSAAHELCHLFENSPQIHGPALEKIRALVRSDAWEERRKIEDGDAGNKFQAFFGGRPLKEIDRSPKRHAHIWKEVMADCYASMWSESFFWDSVETLHVTGPVATGLSETIQNLRAAHKEIPIVSNACRTWYPKEHQDKVFEIMIDLTAAFLAPH